ncbi:MAG: class I SAM-dependent methyltransferase [Salinibacter sp.]
MPARRFLSRPEIRALYDRIGRGQDAQTFYEGPAVDALIARAALGEATALFEMGCGTGRVAERLLRDRMPPDARYVGVDLSPTMVQIARDRLAPFGDRATVVETDGGFSFDRADASQDRVLATYVLDLLSPADIRALLAEAHRLLMPEGRLCLAGLTWGERPVGRLVANAWAAVHAHRPEWVGGCRPLRVERRLDPDRWAVRHREVVRAWGIPSEVLVATPT